MVKAKATSSPAARFTVVPACSNRMQSVTGSDTMRARRMTTPRATASFTNETQPPQSAVAGSASG